jgi:hypothetical protein
LWSSYFDFFPSLYVDIWSHAYKNSCDIDTCNLQKFDWCPWL